MWSFPVEDWRDLASTLGRIEPPPGSENERCYERVVMSAAEPKRQDGSLAALSDRGAVIVP